MNNNNFNNEEKKKKLSPEERAANMRLYLEKLSNMDYSGYLPEESYHVHEKIRGKYSE